MAQKIAPPQVHHTRLVQTGAQAEPILVGSPEWHAWLDGATSFSFEGPQGTFTAHKERRGATQEYWKAYRHRAGRLYRAYLGKSAELTLERLTTIAAQLAGSGETASAASQTLPAPPDQPDPDPAAELHLVATKFALPPMRTSLIARPRLLERLDSALQQGQKLLLISAPAGFGKTTLLVEWLAAHRPRLRVAWLSLDDGDNGLGQVLAYLLAALESACPGSSGGAWGMLRARAAEPPVQAIVASLVNALAASAEQIVLVLDDYHTISAPQIHELIALLLDRLPPQMLVMMTSRADPPLPLARLRVRGALAEVRAADLRFTSDEAADFFARLHRLQLLPAALATLEARTEGWVAGLQLAALALQQQDDAHIASFLADFTGSHSYVFDYLVDEVFQRQSPEARAFLVQTAILDRLCGPLCEAVTGEPDAATLLQLFDQANLFLVRLDSRKAWYRYHPLFRDFLLELLNRTISPAECARLHRQASAWFEHEGLTREAIEHALRAQAWDDVLRCLQPLTAPDQVYDYVLDWARWVAAIPDAVLQRQPETCLALAWVLMFIGHAEAAEHLLDLAEAAGRAAGDSVAIGAALSWRAVACYWQRDIDRAIAVAKQALDMLPSDTSGSRTIPTHILGLCLLEQGDARSALELLRLAYETHTFPSGTFFARALEIGIARTYHAQGQPQRAATLYETLIRTGGGRLALQGPSTFISLGAIYYEWNDLEAAERALREGIALGERSGRGRYWPNALSTLALVRWAQGDHDHAQQLLEQALEMAQLLRNPQEIAAVQAQQISLSLAHGATAEATRWLKAHMPARDEAVPYARQAEYCLVARMLLAQEQAAPGSADLQAVIGHLERLSLAAERDQRSSDRIMLLILLALAYTAAGDAAAAQQTIAAALAAAEPASSIRAFVDQGPQVRSLLKSHRADPSTPPHLRSFIDRLLAAFAPADVVAPSAPAPQGPLSERELTILTLLAQGRSTQQIAEELIISIHTARTHLKHIYAKLDAHSRIQAIERARDLRLL